MLCVINRLCWGSDSWGKGLLCCMSEFKNHWCWGLIAHPWPWCYCRNFAGNGCLFLKFMCFCYFLGCVTSQNLPSQGLYAGISVHPQCKLGSWLSKVKFNTEQCSAPRVKYCSFSSSFLLYLHFIRNFTGIV